MSGNIRIFERGDRIRWGAMLLVLLADVLWFVVSGRSVVLSSLENLAVHAGTIALFAILLIVLARLERYREIAKALFMDRVAITLHCALLLLIFGHVMNLLCYFTVTLDAPLIDAKLVVMDRAVGFDWPRLYAWVRHHALIKSVLHVAYVSAFPQLLVLPFLLGFAGQSRHLREFLSNIMLSSLFLLVIATAFPAQSAFSHFAGVSLEDMASISDFELLRHGRMGLFNLNDMQGLVSMPSFHTVMAVFFTYALRWSRGLFISGAMLNFLMILSTPTEGGHYLMDVFGGLALAAFTIWVMCIVTSRAISGRALQVSFAEE